MKRQSGYTIIEVTLFLALTGLLMLIAFLGTGSTMRSVRFTDTGRSLASYIQKQYDDVLNGVNTRLSNVSCAGGVVSESGSEQVGTSDCVSLGKLVHFDIGTSNALVYDVVGVEPLEIDHSLNDVQLIASFSPKTVTNVGVDTYVLNWEAYFSGSKNITDSQQIKGLLLVKSPVSNRIISFNLEYDTSVPPVDLSVFLTAGNRVEKTNFCIMNADNIGSYGALQITNETNQSAVNMYFDMSESDCNGA